MVKTKILGSTLLGAPKCSIMKVNTLSICSIIKAPPQLHYMEQMMTQTCSQWLTAVTSSPITGHVSEVELQNENQRAQYKQEKM